MSYCDRVGATYWRIGFDEKHSIPKFYNLNRILRHLPDFIVHNPKTDKTVAVEVKGSLNYKEDDYYGLPEYEATYGSKAAPYFIVFALPNQIIWATPRQVSDAYEKSYLDRYWADGVTYRTLDLG